MNDYKEHYYQAQPVQQYQPMQHGYAPMPQQQMPTQGYASPIPMPQGMPVIQNYAPAPQQYASPAPKQEVKDIIARVFGGQKKVLDARNGLNKALPLDYAALHGEGGKAHAPVSVIKLTLCDPSKNPSVTVAANVPPEMFEVWKDTAKQNLLSPVVPVTPGASGLFGVFFPQGGQNETIALPVSYDYSYSQVRVNSYKTDAQGFCPVTSLTVTRQGYYNGKRKLPWTIKISSFKAKYTTAANGTTSYVGSTATDKKEVFLQISDEDFYKFTSKITSFVRVWEDTMCAQEVMNGCRLRDEAFAAYKDTHR